MVWIPDVAYFLMIVVVDDAFWQPIHALSELVSFITHMSVTVPVIPVALYQKRSWHEAEVAQNIM